ncbi:MAG TPA: hypothetical protein VN980_02095 [Alphaproteobacteria bacterium]|nr:hypothetical protein [Alphaproteobacteria bacterium]
MTRLTDKKMVDVIVRSLDETAERFEGHRKISNRERKVALALDERGPTPRSKFHSDTKEARSRATKRG